MQPFDPWQSDADLIVYIDVKSPYAFVAREPTRALAHELAIRIDWRPLTLDIPSYLGSARLDDKGKVAASDRTPEQWSSVRYAYRDARRYARLQGHALRGTVKIWDTSLVHIGMMWAKAQGDTVLDDYLDRCYPPFWRRELDVEAPAVITAQLAAAGADVAGFEDYLHGPGRERHDAEQAAIFDAGIFGVPTYLAGEEQLFGREHLPRVRWLLQGRQGPPPDVAYELPAQVPHD
ncbi:MAG: DsbA family protein [Gammaproteobacteria bacterium]|nr:DsbA family protein [Gammaproteobacteria bacterium]